MKIDIEVPQGLEDVTLHQYQRFLKVQESTEDENILATKMIEIFCNVSPEIVKLSVFITPWINPTLIHLDTNED